MSTLTPTRTVFDVVADFLADNPTPEAILAYRLPDDIQTRAHNLLDKNGEGELSPEEQQEMMDFARLDNLLILLKAKARLKGVA